MRTRRPNHCLEFEIGSLGEALGRGLLCTPPPPLRLGQKTGAKWKGQPLWTVSFPGPDESETELLGPDCQILGNPGLLLKDSQCRTADLGPLQPQQSKNRFFSNSFQPHNLISLVLGSLGYWLSRLQWKGHSLVAHKLSSELLGISCCSLSLRVGGRRRGNPQCSEGLELSSSRLL